MLKRLLCMLVIISAAGLSGCAMNAGVQQMVPQATPTNSKPKNISLSNAIYVGEIKGGYETNPLWTSQINNKNFKIALEQAMQQAKLYHEFSGAKYRLDANLISLKQPLVGISYTVKLQVQYTMIDRSDRVIYSKKIDSSYKAGFSDSPIASMRLKIATEGAARENIKSLIEDLYRLP